MKDLAFIDSRPLGPALVAIDQLGMIDTETVEDCGMNVADVQPILDGMEAQIVGLAHDDTRPDASAGHPHGEAIRIMVAAVTLFRHGCTAKLAPPDDQGLIEQAPTLQIFEQARDWPIHGATGFAHGSLRCLRVSPTDCPHRSKSE